MSDNRSDTTSVTDRVRAVAAGAPVVGAHFVGDTSVFVLGEETLLFVGEDGERRLQAHQGGILESVSDGKRLLTGGDDGNVVSTDATGSMQTIVTDEKRRWIDHVALAADGSVAWSAGKTAFVRTAKGEVKSCDVPSTVAGLAFVPKGFRLAIAHYNGVTLWFPNLQDAKPQVLEWKGSHLAVRVSPDARFVVSAMQEPMLHGWRVVDGKHMRMSGYSARVRSLEWTTGGIFLATSGSEQLILWPFSGKDGPMGKQPRLLAPAKERVTSVACHPAQPVVAVGYADGMVLLVRIEDGAEILVRRPVGSPVSAMGWNGQGSKLAFGDEKGNGGVLPL